MREEKDVRELERLVDIAMRHQLLVCEPLVCLVFLVPGVDFGGYELGRLRDSLGDYTFKVLDQIIEDGSSLQGRGHHLSKCITVPVTYLIAKLAFS